MTDTQTDEREPIASGVCPNCGERNIPESSVFSGIEFFNCPECDFSTWDRKDWDWTPESEREAIAVVRRSWPAAAFTLDEIEENTEPRRCPICHERGRHSLSCPTRWYPQ